MAVTYDFTKITGGAKIVGSDGALYYETSSPNVFIDVVGATLIINIPTQFSKDFVLADIGNINGVAAPGTIKAIADTLLSTVFPKATSSGSVSPGAWYLRGDATTLNSVRINIVGTDVIIEEYNGTTWNNITVLGGPV